MAGRKGAWLAAAAAITFGSLAVFAKLAYAAGWNVPSLLAARFGLAALVIAPFAWHAGLGRALREPSSRRMLGFAFLLGAVGYTTITAMYFPSIAYLPAAVAAFLLYLAPAVVAILASLLLKEHLGRRGVLALLLAVVGLAILASGAFTGTLSGLGVALAAGSAVAYAAVTVGARRIAKDMPWSHLSLGVCVGAFTSYLLFALATSQLVIPPGRDAIVAAVGIGAIATGIALSLFMSSLAHADAAKVSVISTLEPVSTLLLAALVLGEIPGWVSLAGGALIVAAAAVMAWQEPMTAPHE